MNHDDGGILRIIVRAFGRNRPKDLNRASTVPSFESGEHSVIFYYLSLIFSCLFCQAEAKVEVAEVAIVAKVGILFPWLQLLTDELCE